VMTRPPLDLYRVVNAIGSDRMVEVLGLTRARERFKYACVRCSSSDGLDMKPGKRPKCFVCCGDGEGFSNVDLAMLHWGLTKEEACTQLAAHCGLSADRPLPYVPPPAARKSQTPAPVSFPALDSLRADGMVPQLPAAIYRAILDALNLTADGAAYLRTRGLDADEARVYGFRSIDGRHQWADLGEQLGGEFMVAEMEAANLYRVWNAAPPAWSPPWDGKRPALLMPYWLDGEVVAIQLRDMTPGGEKEQRYRALIPTGAPRPPFNADAIARCAGGVLHVAEGELNAFTLMQAGVQAVGLKAAVWPDEWTARVREVRRLVVWFDLDAGSITKGLNLADMLQAAHGSTWLKERTRQVELPVANGKNLDANDLHLSGHLRDYIARAAA
jgi:hypothetical protein